MPLTKIFTEKEIQRIFDANSQDDFKYRNRALIVGVGYWGLTKAEICDLSINSVLAPDGQWRLKWDLPSDISFTGEVRRLFTPDHIVPALDDYAKWLSQYESYQGIGGEFLNLQPSKKFFVNDNGDPFAKTEREKGTKKYTTRSLDEKLKLFIQRAKIQGATPNTFRDTWIKNLYDGGAKMPELLAITGYRDKRAIESRILPSEQELEVIANGLFGRVKF